MRHQHTLYRQHCDCSNLGHAKELAKEGKELAAFGTKQPPVKQRYTGFLNICHVSWTRRTSVRSRKELHGSTPSTCFSIVPCGHLVILFTGVLLVIAVW
jgi:hypothetical protein